MMVKEGFSKDDIQNIQVAAEEACVNIINHGYHNEKGSIWISFDLGEDSFMATFKDEAPPFNPTKFNKPNPARSKNEHPIGGWGIILIRSLTDEMRYKYEDGKNQLTLIINKDIS
jgi:serine/threonine-protein kinase RsbW